ncbi:hypothetical protein [Rubripirellula reticaptiva]|uniref:Uncharacterized protein n=1 Tax=Rubripirellula reticaptiva TaxID=2528013 RepID=A0A5C6F7F8_9BACT|nr:hypothetical protein [Rubripirellula reticaptiva]TWU55709.1 hypothetical protein Poly59_20090 [Rubripirellula reticaptiva]
MSEILALTRLAVSRSRKPAIFLIAVVVIGTAIGMVLEWTMRERGASRPDLPWLGTLMVWSFLPAGFASFVLFDFSSGNSIGSAESNCDRWILRSPIRSWKIAIVPLALKTAWIGALWLIFSTFLRYATSEPIPRVIPCIAFSSIAIWGMAIAWRPMQWAWLRLATLPVVAVITLSVFVLFMNQRNIHIPFFRWAAFWFSHLFLVANYAVATYGSVRAIERARTAPDGLVPSLANSSRIGLAPQWMQSVDRHREFATPLKALAWYEFASTREWMLRMLTWVVVPSILLLTLVFPLHPVTLTMAVIGFASLAAVSGNGANMMEKSNSSLLAPFLVRSPFTDAQIVWTRLAVSMGIMVLVYSGILIVFAGWSLWPSNRESWMQWAVTQAAWLGVPDHSFAIGVQLSILIIVSVTTVIFGWTIGMYWTAAAGRDWIAIAVVAGVSIFVLGLVGWFAMWFTRQTDWESAMASLREICLWTTPVIVTLLIAKAVLAVSVAAALLKSRLAGLGAIAIVSTAWLIPVAIIAAILAKCEPFAPIEIWHCVAFAVLAIPLGGVLGLPIAMSFNRHR